MNSGLVFKSGTRGEQYLGERFTIHKLLSEHLSKRFNDDDVIALLTIIDITYNIIVQSIAANLNYYYYLLSAYYNIQLPK